MGDASMQAGDGRADGEWSEEGIGGVAGAGARGLLVVAGIVVAPFVVAGYLGLALLSVVPLRSGRWLFPRVSPRSVSRHGWQMAVQPALP